MSGISMSAAAVPLFPRVLHSRNSDSAGCDVVAHGENSTSTATVPSLPRFACKLAHIKVEIQRFKSWAASLSNPAKHGMGSRVSRRFLAVASLEKERMVAITLATSFTRSSSVYSLIGDVNAKRKRRQA